jgi:hypothetical protein
MTETFSGPEFRFPSPDTHVAVASNQLVNASGADYRLYSNTNFAGMPKDGDPLGLIAAVVQLARQQAPAVQSVQVTRHTVELNMRTQDINSWGLELLRQAVLAIGGVIKDE